MLVDTKCRTCGTPYSPANPHVGNHVGRCCANGNLDARLEQIARRCCGVPTLETRMSDRLDFHDVACWSLKDALRAAYGLDR